MRVWPGVSIVILAAAPAAAQEGPRRETVELLKSATVMVTLSSRDQGVVTSGSGFVISIEGHTVYLATNHHVVEGPPGAVAGRPVIHVVFRSGTKSEKRLPAEVLTTTSDPDLAILRVADVPDPPAAIDVTAPTEIVETMPVWMLGFPFGQALALGLKSPSVVVDKATVSSVHRDDHDRPVRILIDGTLHPGNSGGPVVDDRGRLVGIAVAMVRPADNIGILIPPHDLREMLDGKVREVNLAAKDAQKGAVVLEIDARLVDPLGKIRSASFLYKVGKAPSSALSSKEKNADWPAIPEAAQAPLKIQDHHAKAAIRLPAGSASSGEISFQVAFVDGQGRTRHTQPGRYLPSSAVAGVARTGKTVSWGDFIDPEGDDVLHVDKGTLTLELPGTHKDLSLEIGKLNAPRLLQEIEGDFKVRVKIRGEFQPSAPVTREGGLPFNGAGLLLWFDADHFIRLERGAVLNEQRLGSFLLFEGFEQGRPVARHNAFLEPGDVHLRIERKGGRIEASFSTDGK